MTDQSNNRTYWVDLDKFNPKDHKELSGIQEELLFGKSLTERENGVELSLELNRRSSLKKFIFKKEDLIPTEHDQNLCVKNLSSLNEYTAYDLVVNMTNNFSKNNFFNFITENIILTFSKYPMVNAQEHFFEHFLLTQEYQNSLYKNPNSSLTNFEHLKDNYRKILSQEDFDSLLYDEFFLKLVQKIYEKSSNIGINFISNSFNHSTALNQYDEIKYLIQNFSLNNKLKIFKEQEIKSKFEFEYKIFDNLYNALKLLEIFGCSYMPNKLNSDNNIISKFDYQIIFGIEKESNLCIYSKINVFNFNREFLNINDEERLINVFYIIKYLGSLSRFSHINLNGQFNLLTSSKNGLSINEEEVNIENFKILFPLLNNFGFSEEELDFIFELLILMLHLSNLSFNIDKNSKKIQLDKSQLEIISKIFTKTSNVKLTSQLSKSLLSKSDEEPFKTVQECEQNLKLILTDIYEILFFFIVEKVNLFLNRKFDPSMKCKEISINSISFLGENSNITKDNRNTSYIYDLLNFYEFSKIIRNFENEKIGNHFKILQDHFKDSKDSKDYPNSIRKSECEYDKIDFVKILENTINDFILENSDNKISNTDKKDIEIEIPSLYSLEKTIRVDLMKILKTNFSNANQNLISLMTILSQTLKTDQQKHSEKSLLVEKLFCNSDVKIYKNRNILKESIQNFQKYIEFNPSDVEKFYIYNFSDSFPKEADLVVTRNNILKSLKIMKLKSYIENIFNNYPYSFTKKIFLDKYLIPVSRNKNMNQYETTLKTVEDIFQLLNFRKNLYVITENNVFLKSSVYLIFEKFSDNYLSNIKKNKKIFKLVSLMKTFSARLRCKRLLSKNKEDKKNLLVDGVDLRKFVEDIINKAETNMRMDFTKFNPIEYVDRFLNSVYDKKDREMQLMKNSESASKLNRTNSEKKFSTSIQKEKKEILIREIDMKKEKTSEKRRSKREDEVVEVIEVREYIEEVVEIEEFVNLTKVEKIKKEDNIGNVKIKKIDKEEKKIDDKILVDKEENKINEKNKLNDKVPQSKIISSNSDNNANNSVISTKNQNNQNKNNFDKIKSSEKPSVNSNSRNVSQINQIINSKSSPEKKESTFSQGNISSKPLGSDNTPNFYNTLTDEEIMSRIVKIQSAWRAFKIFRIFNKNHRAATTIQYKYRQYKFNKIQSSVFIIQRCFRRYLIKKYDLPYNYFYNEKYLKIQHEKFEKNYYDNIRILFPAIFDEKLAKTLNDETLSGTRMNAFLKKLTSLNKTFNNANSKIFSNNLNHSAYESGKIHLFTKILDLDLMVETDEVYENLWAQTFDKIYSSCLKNNTPIQMIGLGSAHTVCVNNKGRIYTFGWNNYGQCGVPINSTIISKEEIPNDYLIEMTDFNELKPRVLNKIEGIKMPQIEEVILTKSIACGEDHTLILDHQGGVWAFGLNLNGQLGLGHKNAIDRPTKIKTLSNHQIVSIKSEGDINFAINKQGETFMWPWSNKEGEIQYAPLKLTMNEKILSISCGNNFMLMLNEKGMLYSMGKNNSFGQLGHGDLVARHRPTLIEFFQAYNQRIVQISCGYKHSVARTSVGTAFTWGLGVKGQLGHGDFNNYSIPYQVTLESPLTKIFQVSAGFRNTFFLVENRKVFFCGCNGNLANQNIPTQFITWEKLPELSNESNYSVVRIMNSWNKSFSIFYATIADTTTLKDMNIVKLNQILHNLTTKWDGETVDAPYIESIAKYFSAAYMKKLNDIYISKESDNKKFEAMK